MIYLINNDLYIELSKYQANLNKDVDFYVQIRILIFKLCTSKYTKSLNKKLLFLLSSLIAK